LDQLGCSFSFEDIQDLDFRFLFRFPKDTSHNKKPLQRRKSTSLPVTIDPNMTKYTLTYFPVAGRAEPTRLAFAIGGVSDGMVFCF
jgi:hypothetical protein